MKAFKDGKDVNFCYLNVFETLSEKSKQILEYLIISMKSVSEISMIAETIPPNEISICLRDLISKLIIRYEE